MIKIRLAILCFSFFLFTGLRVCAQICLLPQISQQPANVAVWSGGSATFSVTATNGTGYLWGVDSGSGWLPLGDGGIYSGSGTANLSISSVSGAMNENQYACEVISACGTTTTLPAVLIVSSAQAPTLTIAASASTVCAGTSVSFTATSTNGGSAPSYQWLLNGVDAGTNSPTYTDLSPANGDIVNCVLASNVACAIGPTAASNGLVVTVIPIVTPTVSITASAATICTGASVSFTANPTNGGAAPSYQWLVNGNDVGTDDPTFASSSLANGDIVSCVLTSSLSCSSPVNADNTIAMTVNPVPSVTLMPDTIISLGQSITLDATVAVGGGGTVASYTWVPSSGLSNPAVANPVASPVISTTYQLTVESTEGCTASAETAIGVFRNFEMPNAFTPNGDGKNDVFRVPSSEAVNVISFVVYDRWGTRVFMTGNSGGGWDGTSGGRPQLAGVYVWEIRYQDILTGKPVMVNGTVILVR